MLFRTADSRTTTQNAFRASFRGEQLENRSLMTAVGFEAPIGVESDRTETTDTDLLAGSDGQDMEIAGAGQDDLSGSSGNDIITAPGPGGGPHVKVFDATVPSTDSTDMLFSELGSQPEDDGATGRELFILEWSQ